MPSNTPTPWAVWCEDRCAGDQLTYLTREEYDAQMRHANHTWICPRCGGFADWSDDNYEQWMEKE